MTMITIDIKHYHKLLSAEEALIKMLFDQRKYTHCQLENGVVKFYDNQDKLLIEALTELEQFKEFFRRQKECSS